MAFLKLMPVLLSLLLLAAHFFRAGQMVLVVVSLALIFILVLRQTWVPRLMQVVLLLGALEWLRTLFFMVQMRMEFGMPYTRLSIILGVVALFTALSGLVFRSEALQSWYSPGSEGAREQGKSQ